MKSFIAVQTGARRNYAVPIILEKAGMLEAFYTDICANSGIGLLLEKFAPDFLKRGSINRLLNRCLPGELESKVQTFDLSSIGYLLRQKIGRKNLLSNYNNLCLFNKDFAKSMIAQGVGKASHVFSMQGEGIDFLNFAKSQGLKIAVDVYISPSTYRIIQKEKKKYSELEETIPTKIIEESYRRWDKLDKITDLFIAPSDFVIDGLEELGINRDRCHKVPYTVDHSWLQVQNKPQVGRILFVGTAELRKGIHILGLAAQKLQDLNYEFRVVGGVSNAVKHHKSMDRLNFLNRISRAEIKQEFAQADILVLPSLAEGSAIATYEALAAGLPVITTEAAGSVVRNGIEGFIIPSNDPDTLAQKIEELVEDRELRDRMALAAKERAQEYTWEKYAERLLSSLERI